MGFLSEIAYDVYQGGIFEFSWIEEAFRRKRITQEEYENQKAKLYETLLVDIIVCDYDQNCREEAERQLEEIALLLGIKDVISLDYLPHAIIYGVSLGRAIEVCDQEGPLFLEWLRIEERFSEEEIPAHDNFFMLKQQPHGYHG